MRALAEAWPGALRELDSLPSDELERRRAALEGAAAGAPVEPWMAWMVAYHELMRAALAVRRGEPVEVEAAFVAAVHDPPHGRLMAAVFDQLAVRFCVPRKTIWDALFPSRKGPRDYR